MNYRILAEMKDLAALKILSAILQKPRITPKLIASEISSPVGSVKNKLNVLSELKLVETPARGTYTITDLGKSVLDEVVGPLPNGGLGETPTKEVKE